MYINNSVKYNKKCKYCECFYFQLKNEQVIKKTSILDSGKYLAFVGVTFTSLPLQMSLLRW